MAEWLKLKKSNCKNCYKCIRHCPVKSIRFSAGQAHIVGNECILCGHCFVVCPQNAKEITDETEKVRVMIESGDKVVASIAPSFIANYEGVGIEGMRSALKKLGFYDAEETGIYLFLPAVIPSICLYRSIFPLRFLILQTHFRPCRRTVRTLKSVCPMPRLCL